MFETNKCDHNPGPLRFQISKHTRVLFSATVEHPKCTRRSIARTLDSSGIGVGSTFLALSSSPAARNFRARAVHSAAVSLLASILGTDAQYTFKAKDACQPLNFGTQKERKTKAMCHVIASEELLVVTFGGAFVAILSSSFSLYYLRSDIQIHAFYSDSDHDHYRVLGELLTD